MDNRWLWRGLAVLVLLVNLLALFPVLESPFVADDEWYYSAIRGAGQLNDRSAICTAWDDALEWIRAGRWFPLQSYRVIVFWYLDRIGYKITLIAFVLANLLVMGYLVHLLTASVPLALMSMLLGPIFFQFRWRYHDPFLAYYFLQQVEVLFILLSLALFVGYLRKRNMLSMVGSLLTYAVCLLVYEAAYCFWILHVLVAWSHYGGRQWKNIVKSVSPLVFLALLNVGVSVALRILYPVSYEGIKGNLNPVSWAMTFFKQVYAALPLTYSLHHWWFFRDPVGYARTCWPTEILTIAVLWGCVWYIISNQLIMTPGKTERDPGHGLGLLGIALWLLPAPLIAASAKYQGELTRLGVGYLPVYVSYFGLMIGVAALVRRGIDTLRTQSQRIQTFCIMGTMVMGSLVTAVNYNNNRLAVAMLQKSYMGDRDVLESAQKRGFMAQIPDGADIICGYPFDRRFFRLHSGKTFNVVWLKFERSLADAKNMLGVPSIANAFAGRRTSASTYEFPDDQSVFFLTCSQHLKVSGSVLLARVRALNAVDDEARGIASDIVYIYYRRPPICFRQTREILVSGCYLDKETRKLCGVFRLGSQHILAGEQPTGDVVFALPSPGPTQYYDVKSITVSEASGNEGRSEF